MLTASRRACLALLLVCQLPGAACSSAEGTSEDTSLSGFSTEATSGEGETTQSSSSTGVSESTTTQGESSGAEAEAGPDTSADDTSTAEASTTDATSGDGDGDGDDAPPRVATMQVYLADALVRANDLDSGATLVQINAMGVRADGTVDLDGNTGFVRRWNFGFTSPSGDISVIYMSEDWVAGYPEVEYPAGNVVSTEPIVNPTALPDSDVVTAAFQAEMGCGTLDGAEPLDNLLYRHDTGLGGNLVQITAKGSVTWGATTDGGFTVWDSCL